MPNRAAMDEVDLVLDASSLRTVSDPPETALGESERRAQDNLGAADCKDPAHLRNLSLITYRQSYLGRSKLPDFDIVTF